MKTKEELQEHAGLVRDIEATCKLEYPADDFERGFRDALLKKGCDLLPEMEIQHVRRIHEALCDLDFPSQTALGVRRVAMARLAQHHELKKFRNVAVPMVTPEPRPPK